VYSITSYNNTAKASELSRTTAVDFESKCFPILARYAISASQNVSSGGKAWVSGRPVLQLDSLTSHVVVCA